MLRVGTLRLSALRKGYVVDWKIFKGYGFIQESPGGNRFFCPRKATLGALFLRPGERVEFTADTTQETTSGLPVCTSVTGEEGWVFPQRELQGIVVETPVSALGIVGLIFKVSNWSPSIAGGEADNLYHYSFSHSRSLAVGDMVRFWSKDDPLRKTAKDVVAIDAGILSAEESKRLEEARRSIAGRAVLDKTLLEKFRKQQGIKSRESHKGLVQSPSDDSLPSAVLESLPPHTGLVPCEVVHFQGRYGKLRVDVEGVPSVIFFHTDMVSGCRPRDIRQGTTGHCAFEQVRHGKNAGTLRATKVRLQPV